MVEIRQRHEYVTSRKNFRSNVKVTGKNFFLAHLRENWIFFSQSNNKTIFGPFYTYRQKHFAKGNA